MKRLIIFAVVGLVIGVGGGTGASVMLGRAAAKRAAAAAADSAAKKDSLPSVASTPDSAPRPVTPETAHTDSAAGDSADHAVAQAPIGRPDSAPQRPVAPANEALTVANGTAAAEKSGDGAGIITATVPKNAASQVDTVRVGRLARLFSAMPARDAAKVLLQLDDSDAQLVLSAMDNRHAAEVLANFPPDRAATMSRLTLRPRRP